MANHYVKKEEYSITDVAVVMLPFPAHGHMGPLLNFAGRLVSAATISLYFAGTSREIRRAMDRAHGWDPSSSANIHFHEFPTTPSLLPNITTLVGEIKQMRDPVYTFVKQLSTQYRRVVVVYDYLMSYLVQDINHHSIQNSEAYRFHAVSDCFSFCFHHKMSTTDQPDDHDQLDQLPPEAAEILKVTPSLDDSFGDPEFYCMVEGATKVFSGDIYNSNRKIEPLFLDLLEKRKLGGAEKVWALVLKIGVEVLDWEHREEIVSADTVDKALRTLMASEEGEKIRKRAKDLGNTVKHSLMESGNEMDLFIAQIAR
ncbi:hypothetical protein BUALT_Bualt01G0102600 [Buddleja alternifolia]|uniref:Glycosyltransferase N-terminal domain-containing protein n=1 Tax=Buddleja alternifolia TaxID=168488 RepID=A0AAV6YDS9_9LAMI|nr:hypothetical protein BUALT_Bualt01G0102600 [Buddleja alternifolia]